MKKQLFLILISFIFGVNLISAETLSKAFAVDEKNRIVTSVSGSNIENTFNVLQGYTTAAFTIVNSSSPVGSTHTVSAISYVFDSTMSLITTSYWGATTNYFDLSKSTSDTIVELVNQINLLSNWSATLSQGCYGDQISYVVKYGTPAVNNEGYHLGLQNGDTVNGLGRRIFLSTGIPQTMYLNATEYIAYRKAPVTNKKYVLGYLEGNVTWTGTATGTITAYEGNVSTNCKTALFVPVNMTTTATKYSVSYVNPYNIISTLNYANEYVIDLSTYVTGGYFGIIGESK